MASSCYIIASGHTMHQALHELNSEGIIVEGEYVYERKAPCGSEVDYVWRWTGTRGKGGQTIRPIAKLSQYNPEAALKAGDGVVYGICNLPH